MVAPQPIVHLLGRFEVTRAGVAIDVPASAHRLVAFLALQDGAVERSYTSNCLWLDRSEERAHANLRSVLWRLRRWGYELVVASPTQLSLAPQVEVDATALRSLARALADESRPMDLAGIDGRALASDLLPGWYDDFVELERSGSGSCGCTRSKRWRAGWSGSATSARRSMLR